MGRGSERGAVSRQLGCRGRASDGVLETDCGCPKLTTRSLALHLAPISCSCRIPLCLSRFHCHRNIWSTSQSHTDLRNWRSSCYAPLSKIWSVEGHVVDSKSALTRTSIWKSMAQEAALLGGPHGARYVSPLGLSNIVLSASQAVPLTHATWFVSHACSIETRFGFPSRKPSQNPSPLASCRGNGVSRAPSPS